MLSLLWCSWTFSSCGEQGLLSSGRAQASHCSGFSCCGAWGPETGSAVVTQGLSCLSACGIFLDQGLNPCPLHWQVDSQPLDHKGLPICLLFVLLRLFPDTCWLKFFLPLLYFTLHKWSWSLQVIISTKYCSPKQKATRSHVVCMHAKLLESCLILCDPMDCSPPGSSVHGILQARILELVAMPFSKGSSQPRDRIHVSCRLLHWQAGSLPLLPSGRPPTWGHS